MPESHKITIVIPTLNEEETIKYIVERCKPFGDEILVVDGHSTDRTAAIASSLDVTVLTDNGKGKGAAIRQALAAARGDIVVFIDADGSHNPEDIPRLLEPIVSGIADHVTGSRILGAQVSFLAVLTNFCAWPAVLLLPNALTGVSRPN